jgi:hypothetical protein
MIKPHQISDTESARVVSGHVAIDAVIIASRPNG